MRLAVSGAGFAGGVDTSRNANQIAAILTESLAGRLADCGGMAGDDASSVEFAGPYDAAAATALTTLADLTDAFAGLGTLLATTGRRHRRAEDAAHAGVPVDLYDAGSFEDEHFLDVVVPAPPTALGPNAPGLSSEQQWILDHVEGFAWPGADLERLRHAAGLWRTAASHVGDLLDQCDLLTVGLGRQTSPEIPLALDAVDALRGHVAEVVDQLAALADSCDDYADRVQSAHDGLEDLVREILAMIVEGVLIAVVVSAVTAGAGAGVATGATIARIAAQSPRFRHIAETLRSLAAYAGTRARRVDDSLEALRPRLARFKTARVRDERGTLDWSVLTAWRRVGLGQHERLGGHSIRKHVGKDASDLARRARDEDLAYASTFVSKDSAESIVGRVLGRNEDKIAHWLNGTNRSQLVIRDVLGDTGISVDQAGEVVSSQGVRVVLRRQETEPVGWRVHTTYPEP